MDAEGPRALGGAEEDEPERHVFTRTPAPAKKSLAEFLAEFERRLREAPGEAATDAGAAIDGRANGTRRTPVETNPDRYTRDPRARQYGVGSRPASPARVPAPSSPPLETAEVAPPAVKSASVASVVEAPAVVGPPAAVDAPAVVEPLSVVEPPVVEPPTAPDSASDTDAGAEEHEGRRGRRRRNKRRRHH